MAFNRLLLPALMACLFMFQGNRPPGPAAPRRAKNIVLMIGDGMGLTQVSAGYYASRDTFFLRQFPVTGLIKTHSSRQLITDSAAGATAFSCGCKTFNGAIGVCDDKKPCPTILEQAEDAGLATGMVASCSITHATPASFVAHVQGRSEVENIAAFFVESQLDLFVGGGLQYFNQRTSDSRNLVEEMRRQGRVVATFQETELAALRPDPSRPLAWFSALKEPPYAADGRSYLPPATRMALPFLKQRSDKGFFLMVEGSQIDWAGHANNGPNIIGEMLDFNRAIGEVLRFARADGETLVIVTADHETGGLAIEGGSTRDSLDLTFTTGYHTAAMVPVFAFGPGAERFHGVYENTEIYRKMRESWGW